MRGCSSTFKIKLLLSGDISMENKILGLGQLAITVRDVSEALNFSGLPGFQYQIKARHSAL
jgi:hypothetical protein